jgi:hypothetical protein
MPAQSGQLNDAAAQELSLRQFWQRLARSSRFWLASARSSQRSGAAPGVVRRIEAILIAIAKIGAVPRCSAPRRTLRRRRRHDRRERGTQEHRNSFLLHAAKAVHSRVGNNRAAPVVARIRATAHCRRAHHVDSPVRRIFHGQREQRTDRGSESGTGATRPGWRASTAGSASPSAASRRDDGGRREPYVALIPDVSGPGRRHRDVRGRGRGCASCSRVS